MQGVSLQKVLTELFEKLPCFSYISFVEEETPLTDMNH